MQTWLVNMRHPVELVRTVGWSGFFSFQFFIGGTIVSGIVYPFLVVPFAVWLVYAHRGASSILSSGSVAFQYGESADWQ